MEEEKNLVGQESEGGKKTVGRKNRLWYKYKCQKEKNP